MTQEELQEQKETLQLYDKYRLLSLDHIREHVRDQYDDHEATDEELVQIIDNIMEDIGWFIDDAVYPIFNKK